MPERRAYIRTETQLSATVIDANGAVHNAELADISSGGGFFRVSHPPSTGERVSAELHTVQGEPPVRVLLLVAWTMKSGTAAAASGFGGRWLEATCDKLGPLKALLNDLLSVSDGFLRASEESGEKVYHYTFAARKEGIDTPEVPAPPEPSPAEPPEDGNSPGSRARYSRVQLPTRYKTRGRSRQGIIVKISDRKAIVETDEGLPAHSDRIQLKTSIDSSGGVLPLTFFGQVTRTRQAQEDRRPRFWVMLTRIEEHGRAGLFRQFLNFLVE